MTPYYADDWLTVYLGDCREVMAAMPAESVHCVVTSPPYWGLRDYGIGGQLGLEPTPELFVEAMVAVFREVRRVLRKDGTVWLNLGDSYNATPSGRSEASIASSGLPNSHANLLRRRTETSAMTKGSIPGLKPKDLVGIPWRVAFALQADGWYLRSDIIWSKPNPMPESVTDRPTKAHEYVFLLSKSPRYYYDADAVREPHAEPWRGQGERETSSSWEERKADAARQGQQARNGGTEFVRQYNPAGRNLRSVWNIATEPYPGAHFATFPRALVEPCIKAGTSEKGVCRCGAPWVRKVKRTTVRDQTYMVGIKQGAAVIPTRDGVRPSSDLSPPGGGPKHALVETTGWRPTCLCASTRGAPDGSRVPDTIPATVLDPFAGSGTTGLVAQSLSRRGVLIDLSADYLTQLMDRNRDIPLGLMG